MPRVLLHICCAPCAAGAIARLQEEGFAVSGYFYNPNIHPPEEYRRRREGIGVIARYYGISIEEGEYDAARWFKAVRGHEADPEGGERCTVCFRLRLEKTYEAFCRRKEFEFFATTLTIGPQKKADLINQIGKSIDPSCFLPRDFKKKDGFKRSVAVSKQLGLYRQHYCGCIFSLRPQARRRADA